MPDRPAILDAATLEEIVLTDDNCPKVDENGFFTLPDGSRCRVPRRPIELPADASPGDRAFMLCEHLRKLGEDSGRFDLADIAIAIASEIDDLDPVPDDEDHP